MRATAGYHPYRYHAMVTRGTPISAVKVAIAASANSQSIAFNVIFGCARGYLRSIAMTPGPWGK
jgi:hypothetical protein